SFRSPLNRFDTTIASWKGFNYLSFIVLALKKIKLKKFK
ncbi:IS5 family transposase, partial [Maribacter sp. 2307ULW6-5]